MQRNCLYFTQLRHEEGVGYSCAVRCTDFPKRFLGARESTGLSGRKVSAMAGLSLQTAHSIEHNTGRMPGIDTCERLADVLGVSASWLAYGAEPVRRINNFTTAPGFSSLQQAGRLEATLRGAGGRIDHCYLYSDPIGAMYYCDTYGADRGLPIEAAAAAVLDRTSDALSVVALGAGHARRETALIENLIRPGFTDVHGESSIEVFLIDTSLCLLSDGYNYAVSRLSREGIPVTAVEGDFMRLQTFSDRFAPRAPRRKLFTLLGFTLGNVDNELTFLRDSFLCAARGDFLLLDFVNQKFEVTDRDRILAAEPIAKLLRAKTPIGSSKILAFLAGPVARLYGEAALSMELRIAVDEGIIPGSYAVEVWTTVDMGEAKKSFMTASKRAYEPAALFATFAKLGWGVVNTWTYDSERPSSLVLFQRGG